MRKKILTLSVFTVLALLVLSGAGLAATRTNNLNVTASVQANCNITGVTDVSFGVYDPTVSTPLDADGAMTFRCTKNTSYKTYITGTRQMVGGTFSDNLNFELYTDSGRTTVFPSDNSGSSQQAPNNSPINVTIYGRVPAEQDVSVDTYSRVLVATVEY